MKETSEADLDHENADPLKVMVNSSEGHEKAPSTGI